MREITFRGKRKDNGEWAYGNYMEKDNPCIEKPTFWCAFIQNKALSMYEVIPDTVGQFTGLLDKHGIKIFEGDILMSNDAMQEVKYEIQDISETYGQGHCGENKLCGFLLDGYYGDLENISVLGNIHDNPKLRKD